MMLIELTYKADIATIEQHLTAHRSFLDRCYQQGYLLASGPKEPRTGGIIIALISDFRDITAIFAEDPFYIHDLADYKFTTFNPVKSHPAIKDLLSATT